MLVLIALVALGYWAYQTAVRAPVSRPSAGTVANFSGDGDMTTEPFTVSEGWELHWSTKGSEFEMALSDGSTRTLMTRNGPGSGTTVPQGFGTYRLVISAKGSWSVEVRQP